MNLILIALIVLGVIGAVGSLVLYLVAKKFYFYEDPRVGQVEEVLPGANCGGCGYPGCHGMAEACVKASSLEGLLCPVGGSETMNKIAGILGMEAAASEPKLTVVSCSGTHCARPKVSTYDGVKSCAVAHATFFGETGCTYGCVGFGDCVKACQFDAIKLNPETGLPEVDEDKCVACGACQKACPKRVIEVRRKTVNPKQEKRVWVSCVNKEKGVAASKFCQGACIACGKCQKVCKFEAIKVEGNIAYIDQEKCKACGICVSECPRGAIKATEPVMVVVEKLKAKKEAEKKAAAEAAAAAKAAEAAAKAEEATKPAEPAPAQEAPKPAEPVAPKPENKD